MHSADFAVASCPPVRLFVCHTPVNTAEHILIFYRHVAHLSSFFPYQTVWQYSDGNGGVKCKGYEKNHDFRPMYRFVSEMMQDKAIVIPMEGE